jgi:uncharacterized membrane protein
MNAYWEKRFWEIDCLRGLAITMMILFHVLYDLNYFGEYHLKLHSGFWFCVARATATIFILLVGISLTLSYSRVKKLPKSGLTVYMKYFKRGLKIFSWGLIITVTTGIFFRTGIVVFGVLHLIGTSIILAYPFLKLRSWNLLIGVVFIALGMQLKNYTAGLFWFVWLGLVPDQFYTLDYFPLFPWFGVVLMGVFAGNLLYPDYTRRFNLLDLSNSPFVRLFCLLGRHSLLIYLIHQPILLVLLYLLGILDAGFFVTCCI